MKCKDIPDEPVLRFLEDLPWEEIDSFRWQRTGTWFWSDDHKPENSVLNAMPQGTEEKLGLAKMRMLMRRGLVDGCPCGCRGDFSITDKGRQHLASGMMPKESNVEK